MTNLIGISGKTGSGKDTLAKMIQVAIYCKLNTGTNQAIYLEREGVMYQHFWDNYRLDSYNAKWQIKKFASALKQMVCILIGCTMKQLEDQKFKGSILGPEWNYLYIQHSLGNTKVPATAKYREILPNGTIQVMTVRELLQLVGTDCMRDHLHPNTWVNALFSSYYGWDLHTTQIPQDSEKIPPVSKWLITDVRFPNEVEAIKERGGILIRIDRSSCYTSMESSKHESETALDTYNQWDYRISNEVSLFELYESAKFLVEKFNLA